MEERRNERKRWPWVVGGLIVVVAVVAAAGFFLRGGEGLPLAGRATPASRERVVAFLGELESSATASGQVEAARAASLALAGSGRVEAVTVEAGDLAEAGDALVLLEDDARRRAVTEAEQTLAIQEANLESLLAGPTVAEIEASEAAVASAQVALDELLAGPTEEEIAQAEANLRAAQSNLAAASNRLGATQSGPEEAAVLQAQNRVQEAEEALLEAERAHQRTLECEQLEDGEWKCEPAFDDDLTRQAALRVVQARENLAAARANLESVQQGATQNTVAVSQAQVASMAAQRDAAQANLDLLLAGPTAAEIAQARSTLADAERNLESLLAGATAAQVVAAEAAVEKARIALQRAQNNLEDAVLRAPFEGVVTAVFVAQGEMASGVVIELVDRSSLEVVLDVDEVDIGELAVGQPAVITLEAWPGEEIASEIVAIAPAAERLVLDNSIATYPVHLSLAETALPVRVGMTANARLQTAQRADVLLVPNRAVTADRAAGRFYVNLVETNASGEETVRPVEVTIGLRDDEYTQITSGLEAGDTVQIGPVTLPGETPFGGPRDGPPGGGPFGG